MSVCREFGFIANPIGDKNSTLYCEVLCPKMHFVLSRAMKQLASHFLIVNKTSLSRLRAAGERRKE
jgi:hypothetical protein